LDEGGKLLGDPAAGQGAPYGAVAFFATGRPPRGAAATVRWRA